MDRSKGPGPARQLFRSIRWSHHPSRAQLELARAQARAGQMNSSKAGGLRQAGEPAQRILPRAWEVPWNPQTVRSRGFGTILAPGPDRTRSVGYGWGKIGDPADLLSFNFQ